MRYKMHSLVLAVCLLVGLSVQVQAADFDTSGWIWPAKAVDAPADASNRDLYCKIMYRGYYTGHEAIDLTDYTGFNYAVRAAKAGYVETVFSGCKNNDGAKYGASCYSTGCTPNDGYYPIDGVYYCNDGFGNGVIIDHSMSRDKSYYAHMSSVVVSVGQWVEAGQIIGYMGSAGASTGKHLHFYIKHNNGNGYEVVNNNPVGDVVLKNTNLSNWDDTIAYADEPSVETAPAEPFLWEHYDVRQDTSQQTNAVLAQKLTMNNGQNASTVTEVGLFLYSGQEESALLGSKLEKPIPTDGSTIHMWYDINSELGIVLTPGTTYYYRFRADGVYTQWYSFTTAGQPEEAYLRVVFDSDGGICEMAEKTVFYGQPYGELPAPTKDHFTFDYWCDNKGHIITADTIVELTGEQVLYPVWSVKYYTISFQTNGGTEVEPQSVIYRTQVDISVIETSQEGYTLTGWYTDLELTNPVTQIAVENDMVLYAGWEKHQEEKPTEPEETKPSEPEETKPTEPEETVPVENPFVDIGEEKAEKPYYYEPVLWAVGKGITTGTSATTFSPESECTRGQIVTFLWRAKGEPEPQSTVNPFVDVAEKDYFYKAVLWAVENGITNGLSATEFGPAKGCTRGQVCTFLWRAQGQPAPQNANSPFTDVTGEYYYNAVLWAVENNITNGMGGGKFAPDSVCTRGQIVTFLYRAIA